MIDKSSLFKSQGSLYLEFIPKDGLFHKMLLLSLMGFLTDLANESGSDIDNGNEISLKQLLMNLATSGNQKHVKLASDLLDLDLIQDNLGLDDSNEQELTLDNNVKSDNL